MSDGGPHPEAIVSIIAGQTFPPDTRIVDGELQLTGHRLAAKVVLREPSEKTEHLIVWDWKTGEKCMVCSLPSLPHGGSITLLPRTHRG